MSAPSSSIESTLVENRVFEPTEATVKDARVSGMAAYHALCAEADKDFEGFWARLARETLHENAGQLPGAFLQMVRGWRTQRLLQLPGPPHGHAGREQDGHHL
jgi:hypothetical protein